MRVLVGFAIVLVIRAISDTSCFNLIMKKSYQQVPSKEAFTILCQADVPLTACQIKRYLNLNVFFDLSRGNETPPLAAISYAGTGLETGQCGVTINKPSVAGGYNVYGCRARSVGGDWKHGVAVIDVSDGTYWTLPVVSGPGTVLADPGTNVTISFATGGTLNFCNFKRPGLANWTRVGEDSTFFIDNSELEEGKCQLTLFNVSADNSGFILTDIRSKYRIKGKRGDYIHVTTLVVKAPPSLPVLTLNVGNNTLDTNESDVLDATCSIGAARPAAHITWLLGDDVIRNDPLDDEDSGSEWSWEFDAQTMTQKVRRKLTADDDGKELVCRVEHIALPGGKVEAKKIIAVKGPRLFSLSSHITWLLIGIGSSFLVTLVTILACRSVCICITRRRHPAKPEVDDDHSSHIYDDVNLNNLSKGCDSDNDNLKSSSLYCEIDARSSNLHNKQDGSNCQAYV